jgi:hypothetical protein
MSDLWTQIIFVSSPNGDEINKKKKKKIYKTKGNYSSYAMMSRNITRDDLDWFSFTSVFDSQIDL